MIKENLIAKLDNGGSPDNIIAIKNAVGASKARFERLRIALEGFSHLKNSHGNMPIDADVSVHPLGTNIKDMEYQQLAMFVISEFCLAMGLPISRVPMIMTGSGGPTNRGEISGSSDDAYEEKKNARRKRWEEAWNPHFSKLGFTFKFRRTNLQDDIRESSAATQRAAFVSSVQNSLANVGKKLSLQAHLELLSGSKRDIYEEDVEDIPKEMMFSQNTSNLSNLNMTRFKPSENDIKSRNAAENEAYKESTATNYGVEL
jgi:hypothetical protein